MTDVLRTEDQSARAPDAFTTFAYRARSSWMNRANASGLLLAGEGGAGTGLSVTS
jgi:hypothetical protein